MSTNIETITEAFSAFKKFGVIGDSLSVGYVWNKDTSQMSVRNTEFDWVQILARRYGTTVKQKCREESGY